MDNIDFILTEMDKYRADGVDFVPIFSDLRNPIDLKIISSFTKDEWIFSDGSYPRSGRAYWKMVEGKKVYIDILKERISCFLNEYDLPEWQREDLEELLYDYPFLLYSSIIELEKFKKELYWEAQEHIETANRIENKADIVSILIGMKEK